MAKLIIGIDFSKEKMNYCCMESESMSILQEDEVENSRKGCTQMTGRLRSLYKGLKAADFLFCGENTGMYSMEVVECFTQRKYLFWLENPLQIKLSSGIQRSKTDRLDARMIAEYACRHRDKAKGCTLPDKGLKKLRELHLTRRMLKECEVKLRNFSGSTSKASSEASKALRKVMKAIMESVKSLEKEIRETLMEEDEFKENTELALSVPGISWVTASAIILDTRNFTRFDSARQYANHTGCVPHEHSSGTSINKKPRVSKASNRYVNSLLTQGALSLLTHNPRTKEYAQRKKAEGKPFGFIVNNIRNKTIHRLFAVIRNKTPFCWDYVKGSPTSCVNLLQKDVVTFA